MVTFLLFYQALIELANEVIAARMVEYYGAVSVNLRGRPVYVQYSNHKELKTNSACAQQVCNLMLVKCEA